MVSEATIKEFQKVAKEELGVFLDDKEALKIITELVGYFDLLAKINHRKPIQAYGKK
jgi:hypothetical protein